MTPALTRRYGSLAFRQYQAAATLAALYLAEEVIGDVSSFSFTVSLSETVLQLKHMESLPYIDTIDRLANFARVPHRLDKDMEDLARRELPFFKASNKTDKMQVLRSLVSVMHNKRIAYTRVTALYNRYGISLLEPSHASQQSKGRPIRAQRTTGRSKDHAGPTPLVH